MTRIFLNSIGRRPQATLVRSNLFLEPAFWPVMTRGNQLTVRVFMVDGNGDFESWSGDSGYDVKSSIGVLQDAEVVISQNTWTTGTESINGLTAGYWEATFDLSVAAVGTFLGTTRSKAVTVEIQITSDDSEVVTRCQAPAFLANRLMA